ncbi:hypothetical protein [Dactylosporangium sp. CA-139066]|uniref:hypothetical protein n=1 Tax=Dactylosporangium sp. CA-139066 TaxID=3239930 RepID=UPI003D8AFD8A
MHRLHLPLGTLAARHSIGHAGSAPSPRQQTDRPGQHPALLRAIDTSPCDQPGGRP